jgi:hypothetical protein
VRSLTSFLPPIISPRLASLSHPKAFSHITSNSPKCPNTKNWWWTMSTGQIIMFHLLFHDKNFLLTPVIAIIIQYNDIFLSIIVIAF